MNRKGAKDTKEINGYKKGLVPLCVLCVFAVDTLHSFTNRYKFTKKFCEEEEKTIMPRGDKGKYTEKQKRQAEHIEEGYEARGVPEEEAERRAWSTVNEMTGGGKKSGSGRGQAVNKAPAIKGGKKGGEASAARPAAERSASAKKAAKTRAQRAG